ncbi:hypothetical protein B0H63DRAFT_125336 [Podospora didyma]|uniref:Uncharacterized protein n=1 Tax=Podospora didyma TaxID=330526 RepID=A0AAE0U4Q4_9PEZI|nr:hypothetical protein B0H63DRAFT_125336 [Podospora didyma]
MQAAALRWPAGLAKLLARMFRHISALDANHYSEKAALLAVSYVLFAVRPPGCLSIGARPVVPVESEAPALASSIWRWMVVWWRQRRHLASIAPGNIRPALSLVNPGPDIERPKLWLAAVVRPDTSAHLKDPVGNQTHKRITAMFPRFAAALLNTFVFGSWTATMFDKNPARGLGGI